MLPITLVSATPSDTAAASPPVPALCATGWQGLDTTAQCVTQRGIV